MNRELHGALIDLLGDDKIHEVYRITGAIPVSFAALEKEILIRNIEKGISENRSDRDLALQYHVSEKTVHRYRLVLWGRKKQS